MNLDVCYRCQADTDASAVHVGISSTLGNIPVKLCPNCFGETFTDARVIPHHPPIQPHPSVVVSGGYRGHTSFQDSARIVWHEYDYTPKEPTP